MNVCLQGGTTPSPTRSCRPWLRGEENTPGWKFGGSKPVFSSDTARWGWSTSTPTPTPATSCWGRRSHTGPHSGAAWRRGSWTGSGWCRSACGAAATRQTRTRGAGPRWVPAAPAGTGTELGSYWDYAALPPPRASAWSRWRSAGSGPWLP